MAHILPYSEDDARIHVAGTKLEIVLKITERCNIACKYCYFFFAGNDSHKDHPALIARDTFLSVVDFLCQALDEFKLERIQVDFHGGEPLLVKPAYFDWMCETLYERLADCPEVNLIMQTNGMLVNDKWIELFGKHRVHVGVSIDGPAEYHDIDRVDHKGRPTHAQVVRGIQLMKAAHAEGRMGDIAALCCVNPDHDVERVYDHLVNELGLKHLNFLLPELQGSSFEEDGPSRMVPAVQRLTELWLKDRNINISLLMRPYTHFVFNTGYDEDLAAFQFLKSSVLTVYSNGEIGPDDSLRPMRPDLFTTGLNIKTHTLADVVREPLQRELSEQTWNLPDRCQSCCWRNVCRGGELSHRFSPDNGFSNPSVYCEALFEMHTLLAADALQRGVVDMATLTAGLGLHEDELGGDDPAAAPSPVMARADGI